MSDARPWTDTDLSDLVSLVADEIPTDDSGETVVDYDSPDHPGGHEWGDPADVARKIVQKLAAAGRLADPHQQAGGAVIAAHAALLTEAHAEAERLRARVAELEQQPRPILFDREVTTEQMAQFRAAWEAAQGQPPQVLPPEQPGRWELPAEPGPEVTEVWDSNGRSHRRQAEFADCWVDQSNGWYRGWATLLCERGPLSATPPETAGGGQA